MGTHLDAGGAGVGLGAGVALVSVHCLPSQIASQHFSTPEQSESVAQSTTTSTNAQNSGVVGSTGGQLKQSCSDRHD